MRGNKHGRICALVLQDSTGGARLVLVRPLSSAASETDSHPFSTKAERWAANHLPRESARRDAVGLALGALSLSFVSPEVARARVELVQAFFTFNTRLLAAKGLRSADNEDIVKLLGRLGTASMKLAHSTDIHAVLQHAGVTLTMPGGEAQLAKWHRLGHLQSVAGGFAEVMAKPSTIATVQEHAKKLLLEAKREAEEQAEKAKREAEEQAEKVKREAEERDRNQTLLSAMNRLVVSVSSQRSRGTSATTFDGMGRAVLRSLQSLSSGDAEAVFLGTDRRQFVAQAVADSVVSLASKRLRGTTTNVNFLTGPKGSGKTTLLWEVAQAAIRALPDCSPFDVVAVKVDGAALSKDQATYDAVDDSEGFPPHLVACVQFALWQAGLLDGTERARRMETVPRNSHSWNSEFEDLFAEVKAITKREVRVLLVVDEFQEFFRFSNLGPKFRGQLTWLMNSVPAMDTWLAASPSIARKLLFDPIAMQSDPRIKPYQGLIGDRSQVNVTKIRDVGRLERFTADQAIHFLISCLPDGLHDSKQEDLSMILRLRERMRKDEGQPSDIVERLRQSTEWRSLAAKLDMIQPVARTLKIHFRGIDVDMGTSFDPFDRMESEEATAFSAVMSSSLAKLIVTGLAVLPDDGSTMHAATAADMSMLPLRGSVSKRDKEPQIDSETDLLVDLGIIREEKGRHMLSSKLHRLFALDLLAGSSGLNARQMWAMLDPTGTSGVAMELLAAQGIASTGPAKFLHRCTDVHPQLQLKEDATDGTPLLSDWLKGMKELKIVAEQAKPLAATTGGPSVAARSIAVEQLPALDMKPSSQERILPLQFHKEVPDRYGSDATVVLDVATGHDTLVRHALRVQVKVGTDQGAVSRMGISDAAKFLDRMHQPFRSGGTGSNRHSLLDSPLTRVPGECEAIVVWNCLVTCKQVGDVGELERVLQVLSNVSDNMWHPPAESVVLRTVLSAGLARSEAAAAMASRSLHPFKSDANGVPVYVVPLIADHKVMLNVWPKDVRAFAKAVGIPNYAV
ncbi:hypothetical protein FNF29_02928 [Cafeteria roenbergensis]|uniref:AAA+ ATPase domain-containing protein n=1 Tax=Cafeteria roenbergensis TaxID=33653 RepID=A0A5A8CP28_CAFRO|nr:hypothetical protein FNF29_02928 [Cafeteria roenbergensis]|eukprot:KAA0153940.1 hypothetical protein FNF29_02928 [Cafeteria roenbergensis]